MLKRRIQTDATLVRRVLAGRREEFGVLVERHLSAAFAVAYARTGNHADAEDAAQESFLRALKTLDRLREPSKFGPWLLTIARNVATDTLIARTRERNAGADTPNADDAYWLPNMEQREMWSKLHEQIQQLDSEPREVLLLFYFAGKPTKEIAGLLSISHDAVRKRLQRARETLGTRLLEELQPEQKLQPVLKKRSATIAAAVLAAPVAWQAASAATVPTIAGIATGKWLAGAVLIAAGLAGLFAATRKDEQPISTARDTLMVEAGRVASVPDADAAVTRANDALQTPIVAPSLTDASVPLTTDPALNVIRGRVVNAATGEGMQVKVTLTGEIVKDRKIGYPCNVDGTFEIDVSNHGYGAFTVSYRNYYFFPFASVDGERRPGEPIPEIVLEVRELATISGYVLRPDGSPAPHASIMRWELGGNIDTNTRADERGHYAVHHDGGKLTLAARQGMLWSDQAAFDLAKDESVLHDFSLPESGEIHIVLRTTDGAIVGSIRDSVLTTAGVTAPYLLAERIADNEYLVNDLPYDLYTIVVRAPGYDPAEITGIRIDEGQPKASVSASLHRALLYELTVRVLDPDENPLADAGVVLELLTERLDAQGNVQAGLRNEMGRNGKNTDASGDWSTSGLPAGYYRAYCNDSRGNGETYLTVPDERFTTLQLIAYDPVYFDLEVVDTLDGDKPLSDLDVEGYIVHADGTISENMVLGENHVIVVKEGYTAYLDTIVAEAGSPDNRIIIRAELGEGGTIEGAIHGADGTPEQLESLYVFPELLWTFATEQWSDPWKNLGRTLGQRARTDAAGQFTIDHLPQGRYVVALDDGTASAAVNVVPGMATGPVEVAAE